VDGILDGRNSLTNGGSENSFSLSRLRDARARSVVEMVLRWRNRVSELLPEEMVTGEMVGRAGNAVVEEEGAEDTDRADPESLRVSSQTSQNRDSLIDRRTSIIEPSAPSSVAQMEQSDSVQSDSVASLTPSSVASLTPSLRLANAYEQAAREVFGIPQEIMRLNLLPTNDPQDGVDDFGDRIVQLLLDLQWISTYVAHTVDQAAVVQTLGDDETTLWGWLVFLWEYGIWRSWEGRFM
jgi:hypothetical protein